MLTALQAVSWSFLSPARLDTVGPVTCLIGPNGSGKSSMLDALKAVCGCRRFGQGRNCASYRYAGRAGQPAARTAYVLALITNRRADGSLRLPGRADELTLILEAGASKRHFLALDGDHLLHTDRLTQGVADLRARPRSQWMTPADYERRVLDPLGLGPAVRRMLELPQGEIHRALDRDPAALVGLLIELSGGRDAADEFASAQQALEEARQGHAEARRRHDRRRAELAERRLALDEGRRAGVLRDRLAEFAGDMHNVLAAHPPVPAPVLPPMSSLHSQSRPVLAAPSAPVVAFGRLRRLGVQLVRHEGLWCVSPGSVDDARSALGPGEALPVAVDGLSFMLRSGGLVCGPALSDETSTPAPAPAPGEPEEAAPEPPEPAAPVVVSHRLRSELDRALARVRAAGITPKSGNSAEQEPAELLGAFRALADGGIPDAPDPDGERELRTLATTLTADIEELAGRGQVLADAQAKLAQAREAYDRAVRMALERTAGSFSGMCEDAGMAGRMEVVESVSGAQVSIFAAERPGEEMRALRGSQASMSGGWRATVVVLAILAALAGEGNLSVLPLDEVGSSLDEERMTALGHAFRRLGAKRDLMTVMTLPTKESSDAVAAFARQQIGFSAPLPSEPVAPPPHIVTAPARSELAAA